MFLLTTGTEGALFGNAGTGGRFSRAGNAGRGRPELPAGGGGAGSDLDWYIRLLPAMFTALFVMSGGKKGAKTVQKKV